MVNPSDTHLPPQWVKKLALINVSIFLCTLSINFFRKELFGLISGYAPHNFAFNALFFIPANLLTFTCSLIVLHQVIKHWDRWPTQSEKLMPLAMTFPVLGLWCFLLLRIFYLILTP